MTKSSQEVGFKKTLRRMLRGKPVSNEDVAKRRKSPADPERKIGITYKKRRK
jgi:hypothetical protein